MDSHKKNTAEEAQLLALLATLKIEATPEANFEERFLYDFHDRVARDTVCCPAHCRVWEHLLQILTNFGKKRMVWGASTLGVGVLAMGIMIVPSTDDVSNTRVQVAKRFDDTVSSLVPGLAGVCNGCTSIRVRNDLAETRAEWLDFEEFETESLLYSEGNRNDKFLYHGTQMPF